VSDLTERLRIWPAGYGEDTMSSTVVGKLMREAADEIARLGAAKTAALKLADERAIEAVELRAKLEGCKEMFAHTAERANEYVKAFQQQEGKLASARKALLNVRGIISEGAMTGFNWKDGDWADRLFASQRMTSAALSLTDEKGT
jgi:hypothetical protein